VSDAAEIEAMAARLREIAERLRDPNLADEQADGLAREAADLAAKAGQVLERATSEGDDERD
jgi:hypothetical protein